MKIYDVTVGEFETILHSECNYKFVINDKNMVVKKCIKHDDDFVDINTMESFHSLKRNQKGLIDESEFTNIDINIPYALSYKEMDYSRNVGRVNTILEFRALKTKLKLNEKDKKRKETGKRLSKKIN